MSTEEIKELADQYREDGKIDVFFREFRNQAISGEDASFSQDMFRYYEEADYSLSANVDIENLLLVDPARSSKMSSSESAIVGVAVDLNSNEIFVREVRHGYWSPDVFYNNIFHVAGDIGAKIVGVEVTGLHEFVTFPLENEIRRRGSTLQLVELQARGGRNEKGKTQRVRSLVSFYRQGLVKHNPQVCDPLEAQLLAFPKSRKWDIMDALGYLPELLEKGERYMQPTAADEVYPTAQELEKEYEGLQEYKGPEVNDFRVV